MRWYESTAAVVLSSVLFPPIGLVLLWLRPSTIPRKAFGSVVIAVLGVGHLFAFYGLQAETDGSGMWPIFSFYRAEKHYAAIESSRALQPAQPMAAPKAAAELPVVAPPEPTKSSEAGGRWTAFRGPQRDGRYDETTILTDWPAEGLKPLWKQPIGGGYGSVIIVEGRAFTMEQRRDREVVAAYDVVTGRELWTHGWQAEFQESMGGDGPRSTPTWDEGRIYALGATGEFHCLDAATGRRIWSKNILADNDARNITWGMAGSPLIVDDRVIVLPGGPSGKSIVAYNKLTGEPMWKSQDDKQAYTSPMLVMLTGVRQILVVSARRVMGLSVDTGELLWDYPWVTEYDVNSSQPIIVGENQLFISAGYDHGAALLEISRAGAGGRLKATAVWENKNMKNKFSSSVLRDGHIYGLDESILACVDVRTGERKWKGGRYGYGQLILAGDHLVIVTESGELALVQATPERHIELSRFPAIEGKTWNVPAFGGGYLIVRNTMEMVGFRLGR